jgi:hypothetical protein
MRWVAPEGRETEVDMDQLLTLRHIKALRGEGQSWYAIAARLLREHVEYAPGREWSVGRVRRGYKALQEIESALARELGG